MNTPETKDKLKNMFHDIKMEDTSSEFMKNLMLRVKKETVAQKRKKQILSYLLIASGVACIFLIPAFLIDILSIKTIYMEFPNIFLGLQDIFKNFSIDPKIAALGLVILLLLIGDTVFRKFLGHRKSV